VIEQLRSRLPFGTDIALGGGAVRVPGYRDQLAVFHNQQYPANTMAAAAGRLNYAVTQNIIPVLFYLTWGKKTLI
jgi:hypothetical protein